MKNFFFKIILIIIFFAGAKNVFAYSEEIPILVYHSFGSFQNKKETAMQKHYRITVEVFEKQMKYLYDKGYHPISFSIYLNSLGNYVVKLPSKAIVLSFDDGLKTQYKYAVPILEKYNFTATFFITTNYISDIHMTYMNWNNLKYLVAHGFEIGSHSKTHPILTTVDSKKLESELSDSKKILENKLGIIVNVLAYPNYIQNAVVREVAKSAGYLGARIGWAKFNNTIDHIYELKSQEAVNNPNPFYSKRLPDLP